MFDNARTKSDPLSHNPDVYYRQAKGRIKKKSVVFSTIDLTLLIFFETFPPLLCIFLFTRFGPFGIDEQTEKKCGNVTCSDSRYQTQLFSFFF